MELACILIFTRWVILVLLPSLSNFCVFSQGLTLFRQGNRDRHTLAEVFYTLAYTLAKLPANAFSLLNFNIMPLSIVAIHISISGRTSFTLFMDLAYQPGLFTQ